MSLTYGQVRTWRAAPLETAGEDTSAHIETITSLQSDLEATRVPGWTGYAADAAERERATLQDQLEVVAARLGATRRAFFDTADAVTGVEHAVREVDALALTHQFEISGTGMVTDVAGPVFVETMNDALRWLGISPTEPIGQKPGATPRIVHPLPKELPALSADVALSDDEPSSDKLPDFRGLSVGEAVARAAKSGLDIEIGDTGVGFDLDAVPQGRIGLRISIVERVTNAGGSANIVSRPGEGTVISIRWPDPDTADGEVVS